MSGRGWGNVIQEAEDMEDEKFVKMTEFEFQAEKTKAKDEKRFSSWNSWLEWARRIDGKRRIARIPVVKKTQLDRLMALRNDYITEPNVYFAGPVQRDAELYRIDGQIRKLDGGRARVEKALEIERQQSLPEIHETIMRVHRQVAACHAVKRIIAGTIIAKFVVRHKPKKVVLSDNHWAELMDKLTNIKISEKKQPVEMRWGIPVSAIKKIVVEDDPMEVEEEQPRKRRCVAQAAPMSQFEFRLTEEGAVQGRRARRRQRDYDANVHIYESVAAWGGAK